MERTATKPWFVPADICYMTGILKRMKFCSAAMSSAFCGLRAFGNDRRVEAHGKNWSILRKDLPVFRAECSRVMESRKLLSALPEYRVRHRDDQRRVNSFRDQWLSTDPGLTGRFRAWLAFCMDVTARKRDEQKNP